MVQIGKTVSICIELLVARKVYFTIFIYLTLKFDFKKCHSSSVVNKAAGSIYTFG